MDGGDSRSFSHPLKDPILEYTRLMYKLLELPSHFSSLTFLRFPPVGQFGLVTLAGCDILPHLCSRRPLFQELPSHSVVSLS
ncbi:hypothetical protein CsSME_00011830 [Camellia sinensis var. sinensis]